MGEPCQGRVGCSGDSPCPSCLTGARAWGHTQSFSWAMLAPPLCPPRAALVPALRPWCRVGPGEGRCQPAGTTLALRRPLSGETSSICSPTRISHRKLC